MNPAAAAALAETIRVALPLIVEAIMPDAEPSAKREALARARAKAELLLINPLIEKAIRASKAAPRRSRSRGPRQ